MRNLKKVLSLSLALVMLLGMMVVGAGAAVATDYPDMGEVSENKQEAVQVISAIDVMDGTENGFEPGKTLNRQMAAVIVTRALLGRSTAEALTSSTCVFTDVTADWSKGAVQYCYDRGIVGGVGGNLFAPTRDVTGVEFAAMLLRAVDPDGDYGGDGWMNKVIVGANKNGLSDKVAVTTSAMTREDAAQMAFNTITSYSPSGATAWSVNGLTFDSFIEAYLYQDKNGGTISKTAANDSLAATVFGLTATETTDAFGSAVRNWKYDDEVVATVSLGAATLTYEAAVAKSQFTRDVSRYTGFAKDAKLYVDGVEQPSITKDTIFAEIGNGVRVEIYTSGTNITKAVAVKDHFGTVTSVGSDSVTVAGKKFETTGYSRGDAVIYTMADGKIQTMQLAEVVDAATVESYNATRLTTNSGEYTFTKGFTAPNWSFTAEYTFYLDSYGNIIKADGENVTNAGNFAFIVSADAKMDNFESADPTVRVRAVLQDGTVGTYNIKVTESSTGTYTAGGQTVWAGGSSGTSSANNLVSKIFSYIPGSTIELNALDSLTDDNNASASYQTSIVGGGTYTSGANTITTGAGVDNPLVNSNTVFVAITGTGSSTKATAYTGKLPGNTTLHDTTTWIAVRTNANKTAIASVVFTTDGVTVNDAAGYAYVDKDDSYTTSDGVFYRAINEDGDNVSLAKGNATVTASGVFGYNEKNELISGGTKTLKDVAKVEDNLISVDASAWYTLTDDTKYVYVDSSLNEANGNKCVVVYDNGNAIAVFVIESGEEESGGEGGGDTPTPPTGAVYSSEVDTKITTGLDALDLSKTANNSVGNDGKLNLHIYGGGNEATQIKDALAALKYTNVTLKKDGTVYTITATNSDGVEETIKCDNRAPSTGNITKYWAVDINGTKQYIANGDKPAAITKGSSDKGNGFAVSTDGGKTWAYDAAYDNQPTVITADTMIKSGYIKAAVTGATTALTNVFDVTYKVGTTEITASSTTAIPADGVLTVTLKAKDAVTLAGTTNAKLGVGTTVPTSISFTLATGSAAIATPVTGDNTIDGTPSAMAKDDTIVITYAAADATDFAIALNWTAAVT